MSSRILYVQRHIITMLLIGIYDYGKRDCMIRYQKKKTRVNKKNIKFILNQDLEAKVAV